MERRNIHATDTLCALRCFQAKQQLLVALWFHCFRKWKTIEHVNCVIHTHISKMYRTTIREEDGKEHRHTYGGTAFVYLMWLQCDCLLVFLIQLWKLSVFQILQISVGSLWSITRPHYRALQVFLMDWATTRWYELCV